MAEAGSEQDERIDAEVDQTVDRLALAVGVAVAGTNEDVVAVGNSRVLDTVDGIVEERVVKVVDDDAECEARVAGEMSCDQVGAITKLFSSLKHDRPRRLAHPRGIAHHQGHERSRDARPVGNVLHRGWFRHERQRRRTEQVGVLLPMRNRALYHRFMSKYEQNPRPLQQRMAGAPISWGICEVPGWGLQLSVDRVLSEMQEVGLVATELGAAGWIPGDADAVKGRLARFGLAPVAAFIPLVLHKSDELEASLASAAGSAAMLAALGADNFVTAVVSDLNDWGRPTLDANGWKTLYRGLREVGEIAAGHGLIQAVHPHVNTLIEQDEDVRRVIDNTDAGFTLDTGHMTIGGTDPVAFARDHADRVTLAHLKDVKLDVMARHISGELTLMEAVQQGIFVPLGRGDVDLRSVVEALESAGYDGWYVFEQDAALTEGEPPAGAGPIADVRKSMAFLAELAA